MNNSNYSNHLLKFTILVVVAFTKKEERKRQRQRQQAKQTLNLLLSIIVFVCESYLFCVSCIRMLSYGKSKSTTSCILLSMSTMSTSNFEFK